MDVFCDITTRAPVDPGRINRNVDMKISYVPKDTARVWIHTQDWCFTTVDKLHPRVTTQHILCQYRHCKQKPKLFE